MFFSVKKDYLVLFRRMQKVVSCFKGYHQYEPSLWDMPWSSTVPQVYLCVYYLPVKDSLPAWFFSFSCDRSKGFLIEFDVIGESEVTASSILTAIV